MILIILTLTFYACFINFQPFFKPRNIPQKLMLIGGEFETERDDSLDKLPNLGTYEYDATACKFEYKCQTTPLSQQQGDLIGYRCCVLGNIVPLLEIKSMYQIMYGTSLYSLLIHFARFWKISSKHFRVKILHVVSSQNEFVILQVKICT